MTVAISARLPAAVRQQRLRIGLSQRQLAARMGHLPRTYVSKVENGNATPTLSSLEKLARALEVSVPDLLREAAGEQGREAEVRDLMKDKFLRELVPHLSALSGWQRSIVVGKVAEMAARSARLPTATATSRAACACA